MRGLSRLNFRVTKAGDVHVAHVDEVPGLTTSAAGAHAALVDLREALQATLMGAAQAPEAFRNRERDLVHAVVTAVDPEGLLATGCPSDEYESEEQELVARLDEATTVSAADQLVRDVFGRWFATDAGPRARYAVGAFDEVAERLAALAETRRLRKR